MWMARAQYISSFMISRATENSCRMPLRSSEHMWQRHSPSGFPDLLILSSSYSCWQRVDGGPWLLQIGAAKGPEWSTPTTPCPTMVSSESESLLPLVGSDPPSTTWMGQAKEAGGHTPRVPTSQPRGRPPPRHALQGWHREFTAILPR